LPEYGRKPYLDEEGLSHPQRMRRVTATHMRNAAGGDQTDLRKPYRSTGNFLTRFHRPILPAANFPLSNPERQMPEFEGPAPVDDPKWNTAPPTIEFSGDDGKCISPTTFTADYPLTITMTTGFEVKTWVKQIHIPCGWGKYGVLESENRPITQEIDVGFGFSYTTNLHLCDEGIPACDCDTATDIVFDSDNYMDDHDPEYGAGQIVAGVPSLWLVANGCPPFRWEILKGFNDVAWDMETTIGRENILIPDSPLDPSTQYVEIRVTDGCGDQTQLLRREVCACGATGGTLTLYRYPSTAPDNVMAWYSRLNVWYGCAPIEIEITPGKRWPNWDFTCYNVEYDSGTEEYCITNYVPDGGNWYCANGGCSDKVYYPKWQVEIGTVKKLLPDGINYTYHYPRFWPLLMNYQTSMAWRIRATDACGNVVEKLYASTQTSTLYT
jgi:hypothetical protein